MLKPEQTLQLQLEVSDTLARHTTRDGIGLALADVINKVVPFEFFLHSIWMPGATSGYRINSFKNPEGKFEIYHDTEMESFKSENLESFLQTGQFLSDPANEGIHQSTDLVVLSEKFPVFAVGYKLGVRSMMIFNMLHENGAKHTMLISDRKENAFNDAQFRTVKTIFPQIKMAFENLFNYEGLKKQERDLSLQLQVNNTLVKHRTRDELCFELNNAIDKVVPFDIGFVRIWNQPEQLGFFRGYIKDDRGVFQLLEENPFIKLAADDFNTIKEAGERFAQKPQIFQGADFFKLSEIDASFKMARDVLHIRSVLSMHIEHGSMIVQFILTSKKEHAFTEDQLHSITLLQPQIKLSFDNVFSYEILKQKELERSLQLELNNVLLEHTDRETFAKALAAIVNKYVPCERFILRVWNGPIKIGYRIPLKRNEDGSFSRFADHAISDYASMNPDHLKQATVFISEQSGIIQGEAFEKARIKFPMAKSVSQEFGIHSIMSLPFKTGDTTCILLLGNSESISFFESQYDLMKMLLPQIMLAFDNLLKYEKMRDEELERTTQLNILTEFNSQKDIDEMALNAIFRVNEFIPFEYWFNVTSILTKRQSQFRLGVKKDNRFYGVIGEELFSELGIEPIQSEAFEESVPFLFQKPQLFTGDDFEQLQRTLPFFEACREKMGIQSLATFPLPTSGIVKTVVMMGSKRSYAFSELDVQAMLRIIPYISMTAQQYYFMVQIQTLSSQLEMEKNYLVEEIKSSYNFEEIVGSSAVIKEVFKQVAQVASTDSTVLILGETGTGKELIARAIHNQSPRKDKVLIKVNCASLPSQLIESELFGHEKGSFTGAIEKRIGKFELANGGTIFLDEIGELPLELQAKLLRVLQEREIERIGSKTTISLDVRIIAATNRDLETEVAEGRFRSDLYYRLSVFPIYLPPLRERKDDIPALITHFFQKFCKKMKRPLKNLNDDTLKEMVQYEWPGNIRELENVIEQAVIVGDSNSIRLKKSGTKKIESPSLKPKENSKSLTGEEITEAEIYQVLKLTKGKITGPDGAAIILNLRPSKIEEYERRWILDALQKTGGRIRGETGAADLIGVKATTLEARVKKLKIEKAEIFRV